MCVIAGSHLTRARVAIVLLITATHGCVALVRVPAESVFVVARGWVGGAKFMAVLRSRRVGVCLPRAGHQGARLAGRVPGSRFEGDTYVAIRLAHRHTLAIRVFQSRLPHAVSLVHGFLFARVARRLARLEVPDITIESCLSRRWQRRCRG